MSVVEETLRQKLRQYQLDYKQATWVLAVSGGVDSMVLLSATAKILTEDEFNQSQCVVAHFNHRLRPTSNRDMKLVMDYCEHLSLSYFVEEWQQPQAKNVEALARQARYAFLARVCHANQTRILLTAHHLNDQTETLLMRLIRGSSYKGWQGIREIQSRCLDLDLKSPYWLKIYRPFLSIDKQALYQYALADQVPYAEDESNQSEAYFRNRLRQQILPRFQTENPQYLQHFDQFAKVYQQAYQAHYENFLALEPQLILPNQVGGWTLMLPAWLALSQASLGIYLRIAFEERIVHKLPEYSQQNIDQIELLMRSLTKPNGRIDLGQGWQAIRQYDLLKIVPVDDQSLSDTQVFHLNVLNQWQAISDNEVIGIFEQDQVTEEVAKGETLVYHLKLEPGEIADFYVRHRQAGDQIQKQDSGGRVFTKKLRRVFIDQKVVQSDRDQAWLVCDSAQRVLWIVGILKGYYRTIDSDQEITHSILYQKKTPKFIDL